jgi:hypothetical protein
MLFRDLLISAREFITSTKKNSKLGFNVEVVEAAHEKRTKTPTTFLSRYGLTG